MAQIGSSPFEWLEFDKEGTLTSPGSIDRLNQMLGSGAATDLVILSHGWNNDRDDAWQLYLRLWQNASKALVASGRDPARYAVAGVLWPAIKWRDSFDLADEEGFDPSGMALSAGGSAAADDGLDDQQFRQVVDDFVDLLGNEDAARARDLALDYGDDQEVGDELLAAALAAVASGDKDIEEADDLNPLDEGANTVLAILSTPPELEVDPAVGGALGIGDSLKGFIAGRKAAAARLLNMLTYYTMKKRAGVVGRKLGSELLPKFRGNGPLRIHLAGHSFGARLVTAAASSAPDLGANASLHSLTLLQGAFSHNAMASQGAGWPKGAFEGAHRKFKGPVVITKTHNDKAVTLAYAIASRLARDNSLKIGDANDEFGAIGANGALHLDADYPPPPELVMTPGANYPLKTGKVHNVLADQCIKDHGDVSNEHAGRLFAAALA